MVGFNQSTSRISSIYLVKTNILSGMLSQYDSNGSTIFLFTTNFEDAFWSENLDGGWLWKSLISSFKCIHSAFYEPDFCFALHQYFPTVTLTFLYPRFNEVSHCPSARLWTIVSDLYLQWYSPDPFHISTSYQATSECVSRVMFLFFFQN